LGVWLNLFTRSFSEVWRALAVLNKFGDDFAALNGEVLLDGGDAEQCEGRALDRGGSGACFEAVPFARAEMGLGFRWYADVVIPSSLPATTISL